MEGPVDRGRLREFQDAVADQVRAEDRFQRGTAVGLDAAYESRRMFCGAAVVDYESKEILETKGITMTEDFPYVPTFLGFRESPGILELLDILQTPVSILMVNGHGTAHPHRAGLACFVGVKNPHAATIGVAQNRLCGVPEGMPESVGSWYPLNYEGDTVGAVLLTMRGARPIFISPGHNISVETSCEVVMNFVTQYKLPLPLKVADDVANRQKRAKTATLG